MSDRTDRHAYFGMVAANDDAEAFREQAIRIISKAKGGAYFAACSGGPCRGGRAICPTPDACRIPEREVGRTIGRIFVLLLALGAAILFYKAVA